MHANDESSESLKYSNITLSQAINVYYRQQIP